jgi:CRISPR-associated protein Cmr3
VSPSTILLRPLDAWFFRDGRPYNKEESNQVDVESAFPPSASTVVGAIRAALARDRGWNGTGRWNGEISRVLGDGFENLGQLFFSGPWLLHETAPLFPAPLHLLGRRADGPPSGTSRWSPAALLSPGPEVVCDLGKVPLPVMDRKEGAGLKDAAGLWITRDGLSRVLQAHLPGEDDVLPAQRLWQHEFRVGLARDEITRTTGDQALYSPVYVRMCPGVSLAIEVHGLPPLWKIPPLFPLGGEGRLAICEAASERGIQESILPALTSALANTIRQSRRVAVVLLTPLAIPLRDGLAVHPKAGEGLPGLPGLTIVSACVGRPMRLGGWDSLACRPSPLRPFFPAGSTWFCKLNPGSVDDPLPRHGARIGAPEDTAYGFGQIVLGTWDEKGAA